MYPWQVITDPGIGFAKKLPENIQILKELSKWKSKVGLYPSMIGTSNKSFLGTLTNEPNPDLRDFGTGNSPLLLDLLKSLFSFSCECYSLSLKWH